MVSVKSLPAELQALEARWLEFLVVDCLDLLEYDFWINPPEDLDPDEPIIFQARDWNSGPCWDVAAALRLWLGPAIPIDTLAIHCAARLGSWYLDGDGFSTPAQMRGRWLRSAARQGTSAALKPLLEDHLHESVNADMVLRLARRMRSRLDRPAFLALLTPEVESPSF